MKESPSVREEPRAGAGVRFECGGSAGAGLVPGSLTTGLIATIAVLAGRARSPRPSEIP